MTNSAAVLLHSFELFARMCFRYTHNGRELGHEPYLSYVCRQLEKAKDHGARIVMNMPPRLQPTKLVSSRGPKEDRDVLFRT
jgi:hypothetical protein